MSYRPVPADAWIASLPKDVQEAGEARAQELIEAYTLRQVREALAKTQKDVAAKVGMGQENVSRLEGRADMHVSTLKTYIEALGGELKLVAAFPGGREVEIDIGRGRRMKARTRAAEMRRTG